MINTGKLHKELYDAGLPIVTVRDGYPLCDWERELTAHEQTIADDIVARHNPADVPLPTVEERLESVESAVLDLMLGG